MALAVILPGLVELGKGLSSFLESSTAGCSMAVPYFVLWTAACELDSGTNTMRPSGLQQDICRSLKSYTSWQLLTSVQIGPRSRAQSSSTPQLCAMPDRGGSPDL